MKRRSVRKAYETIRPDDEARARMLQNILSSASEIPPAGKDDTMNRRKMKPMVIAAIIVLMTAMTITAFAAEEIAGWFKQYFDKQSDAPLTQGQIEFIEENEQMVTEPQLQNNCTIELKSFMTDGQYMCMLLDVTAPEGMKIEDFSIGNFGGGHPGILTPEADWTQSAGCQYMRQEDDGDGKDNTVNILYEAMFEFEETGKPFDYGTVWNVHIEDLTTSCVNEEYLSQFEMVDGGYVLSGEETELAYQTLTLAEGTWDYQFTVEDGDFREIEIIPDEPIVASTVVGVHQTEDGRYEDAYRDVTITSVVLRSMGMTVNVLESEFAYVEECYAVMNDGSRIILNAIWGHHYLAETPLVLDEVDHILLVDGTKLMVP